jgi:hypothetical protein
MDHQQDLDVVVYLRRIELDLLDVEDLLQLLYHHPRFRRLQLADRVEGATHHRQRAHHAHYRLLGLAHLRDPARDVVLEQLLAVRREHGDRRLLVEEGDRQPEVELLAGIGELALDPIELRGILGIGIRLRVELLDHHLAAASCLVLVQQILHPLGECLQPHRHRLAALRIIEAKLDRRLELGEHGPGTGR